MKYKALYKCRLCGAEYFAPTYTTDQDTAATCMTFANAGVRGANHMQPTLTGTHVCAGASATAWPGAARTAPKSKDQKPQEKDVPAYLDDHTLSGLLEED